MDSSEPDHTLEALADLDDMITELDADVAAFVRLLSDEDTQVWRRAWCRAFFAFVEGTLAFAKRMRVESEFSMLDEELEDMLLDRRALRAPDGSERSVKTFLPLPAFLKATIQALYFRSSRRSSANMDPTAWSRVARSISIRNRVVHPKALPDITISDDEMALLRDFGRWYIDTITRAQEAYLRAEVHRINSWGKRALRALRRRGGQPNA